MRWQLYLAVMGMTNFRLSLEKRYSALTGEPEVVRANIARINREIASLAQTTPFGVWGVARAILFGSDQ